MTSAVIVLLASLSVDAGVAHDAEPAAWLPRSNPIGSVRQKRTYFLQPWGSGYRYVGPTFEARIASDGIVRFRNRQAQLSLFPFTWLAPLPPLRMPTLDPWRELRPSTYTSRPWHPLPGQIVTSMHDLDQSEICPPFTSCSFPPTANMVAAGGSLDFTVDLQRGLGDDPDALAKAEFLSATFDFRMRLAVTDHAARMRRGLLEDLPHTLDRLWADRRYTPRERRRILYELWYETDRTPSGKLAAKIIAAFVHERLPCSSPVAYTSGELQVFAHLHPERPFKPAEGCRRAQDPHSHP